MDRNLGAGRVATSITDIQSYGDLYQWGRGSDGHQCRSSATTSTLSSSDQPGNANFITAFGLPSDWRSPQNDNLWQGVNGINNPCPTGYRLPTSVELDDERLTWSSNNSNGAYSSLLKLPYAGMRNNQNGALQQVSSYGSYWSSSISATTSKSLFFTNSNANISTNLYRAYGLSVRCIKQ
jgi:uncharacterized protein (TIGR02145 family)